MSKYYRIDEPGSGKPTAGARGYRGGCSEHDMYSPPRDTYQEACEDTYGHGRRMHGGASYPSAYVEAL